MQQPNMEVCRRFERVADRLEQVAKTKRIKIIDSVRAQKALECCQELHKLVRNIQLNSGTVLCQEVAEILRKYGQWSD